MLLAVVEDDDDRVCFGWMGERGGHSTPPITLPYIMTFMASSVFKPRQPKMRLEDLDQLLFSNHTRH